jgi:arylsulfatase A-like enzyme
MAALDSCFERLFRSLEEAGIADDTVVVFMSDHGDMMLSQGLTTKLHPWDESVRIPLLIRYPRLLGRKGSRVARPFDMPDLMPTVLALAGLPIPDSVEGRDRMHPKADASLIMLPVPITEARRYGFAEYRGLRTGRYTYIRSIHGPWLLYDNAVDPYQMNNLVAAAGHRKLRRDLDSLLDAEFRRRHDEFLPAETYLEGAGLTHYKEPKCTGGSCRKPMGRLGIHRAGEFKVEGRLSHVTHATESHVSGGAVRCIGSARRHAVPVAIRLVT